MTERSEEKVKEKEQLMVIQELVKSGCKNKEIAEQTGIKLGTVGRLAAVCRRREREQTKAGSGNNADRHLCMTCKYRSGRPEVYGCDYIGITEHRRGCKSEDCTKYEKGRKLKHRRAKGLNELDGEIGGY